MEDEAKLFTSSVMRWSGLSMPGGQEERGEGREERHERRKGRVLMRWSVLSMPGGKKARRKGRQEGRKGGQGGKVWGAGFSVETEGQLENQSIVLGHVLLSLWGCRCLLGKEGHGDASCGLPDMRRMGAGRLRMHAGPRMSSSLGPRPTTAQGQPRPRPTTAHGQPQPRPATDQGQRQPTHPGCRSSA